MRVSATAIGALLLALSTANCSQAPTGTDKIQLPGYERQPVWLMDRTLKALFDATGMGAFRQGPSHWNPELPNVPSPHPFAPRIAQRLLTEREIMLNVAALSYLHDKGSRPKILSDRSDAVKQAKEAFFYHVPSADGPQIGAQGWYTQTQGQANAVNDLTTLDFLNSHVVYGRARKQARLIQQAILDEFREADRFEVSNPQMANSVFEIADLEPWLFDVEWLVPDPQDPAQWQVRALGQHELKDTQFRLERALYMTSQLLNGLRLAMLEATARYFQSRDQPARVSAPHSTAATKYPFALQTPSEFTRTLLVALFESICTYGSPEQGGEEPAWAASMPPMQIDVQLVGVGIPRPRLAANLVADELSREKATREMQRHLDFIVAPIRLCGNYVEALGLEDTADLRDVLEFVETPQFTQPELSVKALSR